MGLRQFLYLLSLKERAGKTALAAALLNKWRPDFSIAYAGDELDSHFISQALSVDTLPLTKLKEQSSQYRLVLAEGLSSRLHPEGKVLLLAFYPKDDLGEVLKEAERYGDSLLGVVINAVPSDHLQNNFWEQAFKGLEQYQKDKLILGLLPQDRYLLSSTISEIAELLGGRLITFPQKANEVVEHFMVGVYTLDPITLYFGLRKNKAVILRGDRVDMQLGALETELKLMILTEGIEPHPYVRHQAEIKGIPIMVVPDKTLTVMEKLEGLDSYSKFHHPQKIERVVKLIEQHLNLELLEKALF